ncbi:MAG: DUF3820 family protein [Thalassolituus sp.]|nr:DUF3820 family protein [Thalassolituus oleivorans]PCI50640.1 MAG: hypothetical protein COB43_00465 [Oceanospirillales bacterium]PHQ87649.1 MAG: hypothetical protein COB58_03600 [Thalassobium sp.]AHK15186.1 hypothetical protein R615_04205 [Thalassolituus oleivorans R6-15]APR66330.1 hypothetical protein CN03_04915 [Thalassolituus oleivorans]MBQ0728957.1 DUF3820 family protein [Thalassolituus oleivorans]
MFDKNDLLLLITTTMPFGKYQGRVLMDIPEEYLLWMNNKGFPQGQLGQLLALALELKIHGLEDILTPLRKNNPPNHQHSTDDTLH